MSSDSFARLHLTWRHGPNLVVVRSTNKDWLAEQGLKLTFLRIKLLILGVCTSSVVHWSFVHLTFYDTLVSAMKLLVYFTMIQKHQPQRSLPSTTGGNRHATI